LLPAGFARLYPYRPPLAVDTFQSTPLPYGIVEDATEDLPYTPYECEQIAQLYHIRDTQRLKGRHQATVNNYQRLARIVQGIHIQIVFLKGVSSQNYLCNARDAPSVTDDEAYLFASNRRCNCLRV
jgi:hypothetical protein